VTAEEWQAWAVWAAWATVAIYFVLGIFALIQVLQARKLRKQQARPYVVVDFEPGDAPIMNMIVANLGQTMARDVRIEVDPPLESSQDGSWPVPLAKLKLFTEGIPSSAPGKRIVFLFDLLHKRPADLPTSYHVRLVYEWDGERRSITDEQRLDLDLYRNLVAVQRYSIHHVNETLKKIERQFDRWSAGPEGGLLALSSEDQQRRNKEFLAWVEQERAAEQAAAEGRGAERGRAGLAGRLLGAVVRLRRRD
jgi:hypothetical protein